MKEKVSVLIPTYNVEKFVEKAVRSIMLQTYSNLEIITIDDCSTDNTFTILEKLAKEDKRIKLFKNDVNKKIAETLNFALTQATGKYIVRMDGDDISHPKRIEILYDYLQENPEVKLVGSNVLSIDEVDNVLKKSTLPESSETIKKVALYTSPILHIWMTYKDIYEKYGNYRIAGAEDYDFILRLISNNVKLANVQEYIYSVRIRKGNTVSSMGLTQLKLSNYVRKLYKERIRNNSCIDSFSLEEYRQVLKTNSFQKKMFGLSSFFLRKFLIRKKKEGIIYLPLAILFSPFYQGQYLINRFLYKTRSKN